jgi:hypothetical protein
MTSNATLRQRGMNLFKTARQITHPTKVLTREWKKGAVRAYSLTKGWCRERHSLTFDTFKHFGRSAVIHSPAGPPIGEMLICLQGGVAESRILIEGCARDARARELPISNNGPQPLEKRSACRARKFSHGQRSDNVWSGRRVSWLRYGICNLLRTIRFDGSACTN